MANDANDANDASDANDANAGDAGNDANNGNVDDGKHQCPFAACNKSYSRKPRVREHLVKQLALHDENHPAEAPEWQTQAVKDLLKTYSRPGNLSKEQLNARKKETMKRCWERNRDTYVQNQKTRRESVKQLIEVAGKIKFLSTTENA